MTHMRIAAIALTVGLTTLALGAVPSAPIDDVVSSVDLQDPQPPQQGTVRLRLSDRGGLPPRIAVPDFIAASNDPETVAAARMMAQVLYDDLAFEKEFYLLPRDTYKTIPPAKSITDVPVDRWKELGTDGLIVGSVERGAEGMLVRFRLIDVANGQSIMAKEYSGKVRSPRIFPHTIADDIHEDQRGLRGVARTRIAYSSDRSGELMKGPEKERNTSNVYVVDYDGANEQRVSLARTIEIAPVWSPDNAFIAYTSYSTGFPDIVIQSLRGLPPRRPAGGSAKAHNYLAVWSPDGQRLAFTSSRDGNSEIYVANADGSGLRRLTNHPAIDVTPTWSPTGQQIAWTSERGGNPNIWIMNADGTQPRQLTREGQADRSTWSPAPLNEIAYTARRGGGFDIKIYDFQTGEHRTLTTDGIGTNEQPAFSPTGRHLAFTSTRAGREQIFTIARDGTGLKQITRSGTNKYPNWSK
jgi:TolB protein